MISNLELPQNLEWGELGHDPETFHAFSPDYVESDIGKDFDLTVTLLGYQLGEEEVKKLVVQLNKHLEICNAHRNSKMEVFILEAIDHIQGYYDSYPYGKALEEKFNKRFASKK